MASNLFLHFHPPYSAAALLVIQSAVLATADLSICLSVRPSVAFRCVVQGTIMRSSVSGRPSTMTLVSGEWRGKVHPDIRRGSPQRGR